MAQEGQDAAQVYGRAGSAGEGGGGGVGGVGGLGGLGGVGGVGADSRVGDDSGAGDAPGPAPVAPTRVSSSAPPAEETRVGELIGGRYRLVAKLGSGGFGRVWQARDETLRIDVAVKEVWLPPAMAARDQAERLHRAEREARNAARLRDHPNIVAVHDVVIHGGAPWTVMQLLSGRSLEEHLTEHGPLNVANATRVARALLKALEAAHRADIVHRDVKPANVMLTADHEVVLTDFGIAVQQADTALTNTGSFLGSVEYIAPERARGTDGLPISDLFSLGVTLYHAVEGFSPFHRETATGSLTAVLFEDPPPPERAGPLRRLITGLMEKDHEQRLTVAEALAVLDRPDAPVTKKESTAPPTRMAAAHRRPAPPTPPTPTPTYPVAAGPYAPPHPGRYPGRYPGQPYPQPYPGQPYYGPPGRTPYLAYPPYQYVTPPEKQPLTGRWLNFLWLILLALFMLVGFAVPRGSVSYAQSPAFYQHADRIQDGTVFALIGGLGFWGLLFFIGFLRRGRRTAARALGYICAICFAGGMIIANVQFEKLRTSMRHQYGLVMDFGANRAAVLVLAVALLAFYTWLEITTRNKLKELRQAAYEAAVAASAPPHAR